MYVEKKITCVPRYIYGTYSYTHTQNTFGTCPLSDFIHSFAVQLYLFSNSGIKDLMNDNITEHPSTVNILARMNIYQEVILASIYKSSSWIQVKNLHYFNCSVCLADMTTCSQNC